MKIITTIKLVALCSTILLFTACKKNYIIGGAKENVNQYSNITTYDFLKANPLYDTLVRLIDTAGFKDRINEAGVTFFVPFNVSIATYLNLRSIAVQNTNANSNFSLDSLFYYLRNNINGTRDSLGMYLIKQPLPYSALTNTGAFFNTELTGDAVVISYEYTRDGNLGYNALISSGPQIMYYTHLWHPYALSNAKPAALISAATGVRTLIKTSGTITKNGMVNAMEISHVLFFYGTKQ